MPIKETYGVSQGIGEVCEKSHGFSKSHMAGSSTLQSLAENDKLSCSTKPITGEYGVEVYLHTEPQPRSQEQPQLVNFPG